MKKPTAPPPIYRRFAPVYDRFMQNAPYGAWVAYIHKMLQDREAVRTDELSGDIPSTGDAPQKTDAGTPEKPPGFRRLTVADLACGTGSITVPLAKLGYDMIGVDISPDMLSEAREKAAEAGVGADILFLQQDMRALDLYGTVDAVLCVCDGLNYLADEHELKQVFQKAALFLNTGGVFIFDLNTEYKFKELYDGKTFSDTRQNASYVWENQYNPETRTQEYIVRFLVKGGTAGTDAFFTETHRQRVYPLETVTRLLTESGFSVYSVNDAYTPRPPGPHSERWSFVAGKEESAGHY